MHQAERERHQETEWNEGREIKKYARKCGGSDSSQEKPCTTVTRMFPLGLRDSRKHE